MDLYDAVTALDFEEVAEEEEIRALQTLINGGVWGLQGHTGRAMMDAVEAGVCALGPEPAHDYWGNRIPSRFEVEPGTTGSPEYVEDNSPYAGVIE
jgi:hypothetical protein